MKPEEPFVRHQPCGDRIVFALVLDRRKMKERIMAGRQVRFFSASMEIWMRNFSVT